MYISSYVKYLTMPLLNVTILLGCKSNPYQKFSPIFRFLCSLYPKLNLHLKKRVLIQICVKLGVDKIHNIKKQG